MLSENPYDTFLSKIGYIFIKFGSRWHRAVAYGSNNRSFCDSSLIVFLSRLFRHVLVPSRILFKGRGYAD